MRPVISRSGLRRFLHFPIRQPLADDLKRGAIAQSENCVYTADAIRFVCVLIWDALAVLLARAFLGVTWRPP